MTRAELLALRVDCAACLGTGTYHNAFGFYVGTPCPVCRGAAKLVPLTPEVLELARDNNTTGRAGACMPVNPACRMEPGGASASIGEHCAPGLDAQTGPPCRDGEEAETDAD